LFFNRANSSRPNLESAFNDSKCNAEDLFDILKHRAKENETKKLRKKLLRGIYTKQEALKRKMDEAEKLMKKIDKSIQKYDDIVGYCQVNPIVAKKS
jgi:hypothetical protein